jgi:histidinol phosphatase-like enzyme
MFDEAAVEAVNNEMSRQLKEKAGAYVDANYYCPYHPEAVVPEYRADHDWRKPKSGMLIQAASDFGLDLAQSWMIGDQGRDIAAGAAAGCRTILLRNPDRTPGGEEGGRDPGMEVSPNFVVKTLADAARIIAREGRNPPPAGALDGESAAAQRTAEPVVKPDGHRQNGFGHESGSPKISVGTAQKAEQERPPETPAAAEEQPSRREFVTVPPAATPGAAAAGGAVAWGGGTETLERRLDELVVQLRQQNRNADLRPEFSAAKLGAMILQAVAVVALIIGLANHFTARATFIKPEDQFMAQQAHDAAIMWVMAAVAVQGMVIALLLIARQK